jgi:hypothetical protein
MVRVTLVGVLVPSTVVLAGGPATAAPAAPRQASVTLVTGDAWSPSAGRAGSPCVPRKVDHPAGAEFVSLRASVSDGGGNVAEHTTIHAYRLKD